MNNNRIYTVLVVEDEKIILQDIVHEIENANMGFRVIGTACNGVDAFRLYETLHPDILFTDIKMPIMDGLALVRNIRERDSELKIIILSGYSDFAYAKEGIRMGVKDYLLKPLETESLTETLDNIRKELVQKSENKVREIMNFTVHGRENTQKFPSFYKEKKFILMLFNLGNLCMNTISNASARKFFEIWEKVNWSKVMSELVGSGEPFWIIDEKWDNQKLLILSVEKNRRIGNLPKKILGKISELTDSSVNICYYPECITYDYLYQAAQTVRIMLERMLVIGNSNVIEGSEDGVQSEIELPLQNKILTNIRNSEPTIVKQQIFWYLESLEEQKVPQRNVVQSLFQIMKSMVEENVSGMSADIIQLEYQMQNILFEAKSLVTNKEEIWQLLEKYLSKESLYACTNQELIEKISDYMEKHLAEDVTIEALSERFHYNGTYLTKVFKKYKGVSPLQYLIELRINRAIQLMEEYPGMDMKQISEAVGYMDAHYFSRIFKKRMGVPPTEYTIKNGEKQNERN